MSYIIELNNERRDANFASGKVNGKSAVVEVFSAMASGKDLAPFGKKADAAAKYITELNQKASAGDMNAVSELNEIRRFAIEPLLMKEMKLMGIFGNYTALGWEQDAEVEVTDIVRIGANIQAEGQDVKLPVARKKRIPVPTVTISGGYSVNYRKAALGDMSDENELMDQVRIQIRNKAAKYVIETMYTAIANATGIKYMAEDAGLTKTDVDAVIAKVRRNGRTTVLGDYALISQFNNFAGFAGTTPAVNGISEAVMKEIHDNGIMGAYNGSILSVIPNEYDFTKLNAAGDNFDTVLPAGLGFVVPTGAQSPIVTVTRGGLTSLSGNDIATGELITRFDLSVGALVVPGREHMIGMIHDTNLDDLGQ